MAAAPRMRSQPIRILEFHDQCSGWGLQPQQSAEWRDRAVTQPTLSWGTSTGATSYEYCYDTTNDSACSGWANVGTNTSAGLSGLTAGTTYYWLVRANSAGGITYANGAATAFWISRRCVARRVCQVEPVKRGDGPVVDPTVSWGASTGATSYEYCYDTTNDNACTTWVGVGANSMSTDADHDCRRAQHRRGPHMPRGRRSGAHHDHGAGHSTNRVGNGAQS